MTRAEINRRSYDKRRKVHAGGPAPLCRTPGAVVGQVVTCGLCLAIQKARSIGANLNEWDRKRLDELEREKIVEKARAYRAQHPDRVRAAAKRWREKYPDLMRIAKREWRAKNLEHARAYHRNWYHKKRAAIPSPQVSP